MRFRDGGVIETQLSVISANNGGAQDDAEDAVVGVGESRCIHDEGVFGKPGDVVEIGDQPTVVRCLIEAAGLCNHQRQTEGLEGEREGGLIIGGDVLTA